jgi:hypothetical protein
MNYDMILYDNAKNDKAGYHYPTSATAGFSTLIKYAG